MKTHYSELIIKATNCKENEVKQVEDIMRNDIVHSTLDWLSPKQFYKAAKEAYEVYLFIHSDEGEKYISELMMKIS